MISLFLDFFKALFNNIIAYVIVFAAFTTIIGSIWWVTRLFEKENVSRTFKIVYSCSIIINVIVTIFWNQYPLYMIVAVFVGLGLLGLQLGIVTIITNESMFDFASERVVGIILVILAVISLIIANFMIEQWHLNPKYFEESFENFGNPP